MLATTPDDAGAPHEAVLVWSPDHRQAAVGGWMRSAASRGEKIATLAAPPSAQSGHPPPDLALLPGRLPPEAALELVRGALDEGFGGLSLVVWADRLIASTSRGVHTDLEATLTGLCGSHPLSALCLYDRKGVGADQLDTAVSRHPDGLRERHLELCRTAETLHVRGEVDMSNLDVLAAALPAGTPPRSDVVRIELSAAPFLSAGAVQALDRETRAFRAGGGRVELHGVTPHVGRVLRLLGIHSLPGLVLTS